MQNRYAGDFGDFVKFGILRALFPDRRVGIAWWLYPNETHNSDGKHTKYLDRSQRWAAFDPELFAKLKGIRDCGVRQVSELESTGILPNAVFASQEISIPGSRRERIEARKSWFASVLKTLATADVIFVDPDNGLQPDGFSIEDKKAGKSVSYEELLAFSSGGRPVIAYHHQTRRKGGHLAEISYLSALLRDQGFRTVDAIRARNYSPRVFFILNGAKEIRTRAVSLAERWNGSLSWHPGE